MNPQTKTKRKWENRANIKKILRNFRLMLTAKMMQQLWAVIESIQLSTLLQFDDAALVQLLLKQFTEKQVLDQEAKSNLNS